ncbi:heparan-alpha-glucosaminide N-acetyltransferase [Sulfurimonas sp. ST-27]|uniref:heparan-alpha-glucosaminide N-acetyltransferase n=1 Tax=unclassified Sulfurimonas TaxID=2623549 RepID=UPI003AB6337D
MNTEMSKLQTRYFDLDFIRGIAIVLMVVFHFCFDLNNFHFIDINIYHGVFWHYFRYVIVSLFLLCVGVSLYLVNESGYNFTKDLKRFFLIFANAMLVSAASYFTFPHSFIYFGILHFIAFASLLALAFVKFPKIALLAGITIIVLSYNNTLHMHWLYNILKMPLHLPKHPEDLVPFTPWFGVVLVGIFIGCKKLFIFNTVQNYFTKKVSFLGKHSLLIYMIHQPVLFGTVFSMHEILE